MDEPEEWRPVVGWEGRYEVSDVGRVRNNAGRLIGWANKDGYRSVHLHGPTKKRLVHHLVLEAFQGAPVIHGRHLDGDRANNRSGNLAWGTARENEADKRRHGRDNAGTRNGMAKLTEAQAVAVRSSAQPQKEIAKSYGICIATVSAIKRGHLWKEAV